MPLTYPENDNCGSDKNSKCPASAIPLDDVSVSNLRRVFELLDAWNRELCEHTTENEPNGTPSKNSEEDAA